jgi:predicted DNA-binding transcriptional regulator YafY
MPHTSLHGRLERLDLLATRLKEPMTVAELANEFGISSRTLSRDLALLRERGLPIEADRGRGGGVRLNRMWGIGRLSLSYREAVELLVSLAIAEQLRSPWLIANLAPIRRKLVASFAPVGGSASADVLGGFSGVKDGCSEALFRAFLETKLLSIGYRDMKGRRTERQVEPQILLLSYPIWYLVAWDQGRGAVRSFRLDRIERAQVQDQHFN